jgi:hypothetical protein
MMDHLSEMSPNYRYMGWSTTVDGVSTGTSYGRDGPFSFGDFVERCPSSHIVEYLVFAPLCEEWSDDAYFDLGKKIRVQTREHLESEAA